MAGDVHPVRRALAQRPIRVALEVVLGLLVVLCVAFALSARIGDLDTSELRFVPGWFALATLGFTLLQLSHAELWRRQLRRLGSDLPPRRARAIWCASVVARYVPTSLLMPTLRISMSERLGVPKRRSLASLVYEAALAISGAIAVAGYFVMQLPELKGSPARWLAPAAGVAAVVVLHPRIFGPLSSAGLRRLGRDPLELLLPERLLLKYWAGYAASFVLAGLSLFALAQALHPVDVADMPQVVGAFAVGFSVSLLAFMLPGGIGAREAGLAAALAPAMPTVIAIAVAIIARVVQIAIELLAAVVTQALARREPLPDRVAMGGAGAPPPPQAAAAHADEVRAGSFG